MAKLSPEALEKIAAALPDTYEANPDQFAADYQALQQAQGEAERLQQLSTWFQNDYQPWFQTYGGDFAEFQRWKQSGGQPASATPEPTRDASTPIDYDSPDALKDAVQYFQTRLEETQNTLTDRLKLTDATIAQRSEELQRLLALQEQAYGLINEATWERIEPGWKPQVDIPKLVTYAQQHNIPDLRRAYQSYSQTDREKELERRAYERGRQEATREANSQVTTEMGAGGTPFKHALPADRKTGTAGTDDIINRIHARWAQRRGGNA